MEVTLQKHTGLCRGMCVSLSMLPTISAVPVANNVICKRVQHAGLERK